MNTHNITIDGTAYPLTAGAPGVYSVNTETMPRGAGPDWDAYLEVALDNEVALDWSLDYVGGELLAYHLPTLAAGPSYLVGEIHDRDTYERLWRDHDLAGELRSLVAGALDLEDLARSLNVARWIAGQLDMSEEEWIDLTSLPVFGDLEPADTQGIYSWDDARVLRCDGCWELDPR